MKRLILIRHAKSNWNQPLVSDHDRIINDIGKSDAKLIGKYLYQAHYTVSHMISSSAIRTLQTAKIISKEIKFEDSIETQSLIYNSAAEKILNLIYNINNKFECVILVGHNPTITELANHISNIKIDNIPTSGTMIIDFECQWKQISNNGKLIDFITPDKLKAV